MIIIVIIRSSSSLSLLLHDRRYLDCYQYTPCTRLRLKRMAAQIDKLGKIYDNGYFFNEISLILLDVLCPLSACILMSACVWFN